MKAVCSIAERMAPWPLIASGLKWRPSCTCLACSRLGDSFIGKFYLFAAVIRGQFYILAVVGIINQTSLLIAICPTTTVVPTTLAMIPPG